MIPESNSLRNKADDVADALGRLEGGTAAELAIRAARPTDWIVELDDQDVTILTEAAKRVMAYNYVENPEEWVTEAQLRSADLSERLRRKLITFRRFGSSMGGLLVKGLPTGQIPDTPSEADNDQAPSLLATAATSVLLATLGDQYGFKPELGGKMFQSILPERGAERTQRSVGSQVYLEDHIEMAFTEFRADYVVLTCVRADHDRVAGTALASIDDILPLLAPQSVGILRERRFRTTVDESFLIGWDREDEPIWVDPISVFEGAHERPRVRVDFAETEGKDPEAQDALDQLKQAALQARKVIRLEPGDVIITDNMYAMHGRSPFTPRYDGRDRWLLRTFVTKNLAQSLEVRPDDGRVVNPDHRVWLDAQ